MLTRAEALAASERAEKYPAGQGRYFIAYKESTSDPVLASELLARRQELAAES